MRLETEARAVPAGTRHAVFVHTSQGRVEVDTGLDALYGGAAVANVTADHMGPGNPILVDTGQERRIDLRLLRPVGLWNTLRGRSTRLYLRIEASNAYATHTYLYESRDQGQTWQTSPSFYVTRGEGQHTRTRLRAPTENVETVDALELRFQAR